MRSLLFRSGLRPRLLSAGVFAALVFGSVALLTRPESPAPQAGEAQASPLPASASESWLRIEIESVRAIESWQVSHANDRIEAAMSTPHVWEATFRADAASERSVLSIVTAAADRDYGAANALHLRLFAVDSVRPLLEQTAWCSGPDCAVELQLKEPPR